ncbi:interferon alpha-3-like [Perognathus longimembris pacificus]|uniref:interferon alpha-3-like n=1 Tax=Perognathus longimembris pacificus TaxID=214514 RepID=UPI0020189E44|nr:interferon alpha-3-like [Perognathus longimembris pacificus]
MALPLVCLVSLLVLSCRTTCSLGCELPPTHSLGNKRALLLLGQMRRTSLFSSLQDRKDFGFPQEAFDAEQVQKAEAIAVLHEMTQQIYSLFSTKSWPAPWEKSLVATLCTGLSAQLHELRACVAREEGEEAPAMVLEDSTLAVRRHFHRISLYLQEKKFSPCAWEVVRAEIMRYFSSSADLLESIKSEE